MQTVKSSILRGVALIALLAVAGCGHARPGDAKAEGDLTDTTLNAGAPDMALRLADAALKRNPNNADALTRRGQALTDLGRLAEARETLRKAVAADPRNGRALLALGRVELPVDPAAAADAFESALKQDTHNAVLLSDLGIARDLQGRHAEAEKAYRDALVTAPNMVSAQVNLALCLAMRGNTEEAIRLLRPLAEQSDATKKIKENYAAVLAMAGHRDQAEHIMASDLSADEVAPALDLLASARVAETAMPAAQAATQAAPVSQTELPAAPIGTPGAPAMTAKPAAPVAQAATAAAKPAMPAAPAAQAAHGAAQPVEQAPPVARTASPVPQTAAPVAPAAAPFAKPEVPAAQAAAPAAKPAAPAAPAATAIAQTTTAAP